MLECEGRSVRDASLKAGQERVHIAGFGAETGQQREVEIVRQPWRTPSKVGDAANEAELPALVLAHALDASAGVEERVHARGFR